MLNIETYKNHNDLTRGVVESLTFLIKEALAEGRAFHLALTGGRVGGEIAQQLAIEINEAPDNFTGLHIWWSDERFVPIDSPDLNAKALLESLAQEAAIHIHRPSSSDSNVDVETAARRYAADIHGIDMDVTLLSIGTDGHVASLFPARWNVDEEAGVIAVLDAPKEPPQRISFSMSKINSSKRVWLLAAGDEKKSIVERLRSGDSSIPVTFVHGREETLLFNDFS